MSEQLLMIFGNKNLPEGTPERPLVTFAVFAYNQEKYIREAVEGAFTQTYSPLEIILSDDASTDETFEIIQKMASEYNGPHRILIRKSYENQGVLRHVLEVFHLSSGKYVVCAAGDDISMPSRTEILVDTFMKSTNGVVALYSNSYIIDEKGVVGNFFILRRQSQIHGATAAYDKIFFTDISVPKKKLMLEDKFFSLLITLSNRRFVYIDMPLVFYRQTSSSLANFKKDDKFLLNLRRQCKMNVDTLLCIVELCKKDKMLSKRLNMLAWEINSMLEFSENNRKNLSWSTVFFAFLRARWTIPLIFVSGNAMQKYLAVIINFLHNTARAFFMKF